MQADPFYGEYLRQYYLISDLITTRSIDGLCQFRSSPFVRLDKQCWGSAATIFFPETVLRVLMSLNSFNYSSFDIHSLHICFLIVIRDRYLRSAFCGWLHSSSMPSLSHFANSLELSDFDGISLHIHAQIMKYYRECADFSGFLATTVLRDPLVLGYDIEVVDSRRSCYLNTYELRSKFDSQSKKDAPGIDCCLSPSVVHWLRAHSIDFWSIEERKNLKNFLTPSLSNHLTLVLPDANLGIGDYVWEISKILSCSAFSGCYQIVPLKQSYALIDFISKRFRARKSNFEILARYPACLDRYDRITSLYYLWSDLIPYLPLEPESNFCIPSLVENTTLCLSGSLKIGIHAYSRNKNKKGHSYGISWVDWILQNTLHSIILLHPVLDKNDIDFFAHALAAYPGRISFPPRPVAANPDELFRCIQGLDVVIGVSSTSVCISSVIGVPTYVLLPSSLIMSKWSAMPEYLQSNTTLICIAKRDSAVESIGQIFSKVDA
ncbi:hypothetical protein [Synechococcus sp. A15-60]|uniref:hypothetical protein n=1 Tax=Synechococcus sp. A15-60 TaxID=1050655 RepID=UPI001645A785|nr:hypothetical protein [Synechococcus sp. A15-60]QNI46804.1 hypothetical protein SynA1560_00105 [Synechococcus sp. A15-60]